MAETSPPLGFCCRFYKGAIVLLYNGRGGKDKVAQTAQNRKISFAESLLFYYLARQALSFGRRGREREERDVINKTDCFFFFFYPFLCQNKINVFS